MSMEIQFEILSDMARKSIEADLCILFFQDSLLIKDDINGVSLPTLNDVKKLNIQYKNQFFIGKIKEQACFAMEAVSELKSSEGFKPISLREFGMNSEEVLFSVAGRANQIINWDRTHQFCGKCGSKTENKQDELAKICSNCGNVMYPVICPAIIVAITKGDKILLAHNKNFKNNMYSLIAGFVEAGEDLESAVSREVFEEVGIRIKNIKYYKSSPWSFPNSLMLGFFAEYDSGIVKVDGEEIIHADWYSKNELPNLPQGFSLARKLIDEFIDNN